MPVTFAPAPRIRIESRKEGHTWTSASLLDSSNADYAETPTKVKEHLQGSFGRDGTKPVSVSPMRNGFVTTIVDAYCDHQALVLRPDDVWLAILTQFNLFLNGEGRAERLRYLFVAHEGRKKLTVCRTGTRRSVDFGGIACQMTGLMDENVVDPHLRAWVLPAFSTTQPHDTVVASVVMLATFKAYFQPCVWIARCGLPRVTLLGTHADWLEIAARVETLDRYGPETAAWRDLLRPVLARFARAFEPGYADSAENLDFWQRVVSHKKGGSGTTRLAGWITAFCAFSTEGVWQGGYELLERHESAQQSGVPLSRAYTMGRIVHQGFEEKEIHRAALEIDGVCYPGLNPKNVPIGHAEVDVALTDNRVAMDGRMVAGLVGVSVTDAALANGSTVPRGQVSPASAWWMFVAAEEEGSG